jgi:hypothetical protein
MAIAPAGYYENQAAADQFAMAFIKPGTTVVSDMGAAFNHMADVIGGEHLTVNHSKFYKDPKTGVHSNDLEGCNHLIKAWMNRHGRGNCSEDVLWRNCAQYVWEQWYKDGSGTMKFTMFLLALLNKWGFN